MASWIYSVFSSKKKILSDLGLIKISSSNITCWRFMYYQTVSSYFHIFQECDQSPCLFPFQLKALLSESPCFWIVLIILFFFSRILWLNFYGTIFLPSKNLHWYKTFYFQNLISIKIFYFQFHDPIFEWLCLFHCFGFTLLGKKLVPTVELEERNLFSFYLCSLITSFVYPLPSHITVVDSVLHITVSFILSSGYAFWKSGISKCIL